MFRVRPSTPSRSSRSPNSPRAGKRCWPAPGTAAAAPRDGRRRRRRRRTGACRAQYRLAATARRRRPRSTLVTREALLPSHNRARPPACSRGFSPSEGSRSWPASRHAGRAGRLICADGAAVAFDEALWVTEAARRAMACRDRAARSTAGGFVEIDETLRSPADARCSPPATSRRCAAIRARRPGSTRCARAAARRQSASRAGRRSRCAARCRNGGRWR